MSPLVNDEDQAPSGGVLGKTNSIFIERKDGILLRCMQILKYLPQKTSIFKVKIVPQNAF